MPPRFDYLSRRPAVLGLAKALFLALGQLPIVRAAPLYTSAFLFANEEEGAKPPDGPSLWIYLTVAAALVLLGGAFAGLTIALMGQDEIYLQVIKESGDGVEKKHATRVLRLLNRGKHWVLVTLLLGNVITNETLPIVLDRSLGGGWPAVLGSTVLIVIFGEIAPQSVCVRYGLPIGAWMSPFVLALMYILSPMAWPTAKLLDWLLGEDHGTVYKKSGLKTLVSLHKTLGDTGQKLNEDEVTIIGAVLDLKDKSVGSIMTPMDDVYTLSLDDVLDEETMDELLSQGYSRIPIHHPDNDNNFVGMLLVKMLITYDPEDALPVRDFSLATLPETRSETSCLDIINFFQDGKSHMVLVSDNPGEDHGALGVLTLEDVIEELIGEEIVDESDVFIDVHKAIRRLAPAPRTRIPKGQVVESHSPVAHPESDLINIQEGEPIESADVRRTKTLDPGPLKTGSEGKGFLPRQATFPIRRRPSATDQRTQRYNTSELREHLKHLGPSNVASRPKTTRSKTVKIKPGSGMVASLTKAQDGFSTPSRRVSETGLNYDGGLGEGLLSSAGKDASDGVQALAQGYGSFGSPTRSRPNTSTSKAIQAEAGDLIDFNGQDYGDGGRIGRHERDFPNGHEIESQSQSTVRSLPNENKNAKSQEFLPRGPARSGSITENIVDANGIRKIVLETTSSSSSTEEDNSGANKLSRSQSRNAPEVSGLRGGGEGHENAEESQDAHGKKRRRRRRKHGHIKGEQKPLLGVNK